MVRIQTVWDCLLLKSRIQGHAFSGTLKPDYVLIDSRTSHTEVGGICTRQLPDTVVVLLIPNEQNLDGVSSVVDAIRAENAQNRTAINIDMRLAELTKRIPCKKCAWSRQRRAWI